MYTPEQRDQFEQARLSLLDALHALSMQHVMEGQHLLHDGVREHLLHGAARRLGVMRRAIARIFELFPLDQSRPLNSEALEDVQINLHAFVINLSGIFDNWAWAYVFRHGLLGKIGNRRDVGLFNQLTKPHLPVQIRDYLSSSTIMEWRENYLRNYRDALAHRIPLYIPPAEFTPEECARYNELEVEKIKLIRDMNWTSLEVLYAEQAALGLPSFTFLHSFAEDEPSRPLFLHPQLITDGQGVVEFGQLFLKYWNESA